MEEQALARQLGAWSTGKGVLQQKLTRALMETVRSGAIGPGLRLPSERALAQALTVSRTTVVAAYDALREGGWVESLPGSGTRVAGTAVVQAARGSAQAAALAASPLLGLLGKRGGEDVLDFALGSPLPLAELPGEVFVLPADEQAALLRDRLYHPLGLAGLRRAVAAELTRQGLETRLEQVLITGGAQQGISLCAALCLQRGDTALVEDPAYFGAMDAFRLAGARLAGLPVEAHGVTPGTIRERVAATAARLIYLTPTYQNPTGVTMGAGQRREIARVVAERGVPLIDDRTMADLILDGPAPAPIASFAEGADIFTIGSVSKLVWPGLRIGWVRAPEPLIERLARVKSAMDLGSPLLTQAIGVRVLGQLGEARRLRRLQLKPRRDRLAALLGKHLPSWRFVVPAGGLFLWVEIPRGDSREFAQLALRHGVVLLTGPTMSVGERHARFLRLPFFWEEEVLEMGVRRLAAAWAEYRPGGAGGGAVLV